MKTFLCSAALLLLILTDTRSAKSVEIDANTIKEGNDGAKQVKIDAHTFKEGIDGAKSVKNNTHAIKEGIYGAKSVKNNTHTIKEGIDGAKPVKIEYNVEKLANCLKCPNYEKPMDCAELRENGVYKSGIYTIYSKNRVLTSKSFEVYCDMETDGGGWTVIQRRGQYGNREDYFSRNWKEYKEGFGDLKKEFWLGNDKIHSLTNQDQYSARFDLKKDELTGFERYENFWIEDEENFYLLRLSEGSGPAGNSIDGHNGFRFYTKDRPDQSPGKWQRSGGWWKNGKGTSSLNGLNLYRTGREDSEQGISWLAFGRLVNGFKNSLESCEIKVRPKKFITKVTT